MRFKVSMRLVKILSRVLVNMNHCYCYSMAQPNLFDSWLKCSAFPLIDSDQLD